MFARFATRKNRCAGLVLCAAMFAGVALVAGCTQMIGNNAPYYKNGPAQREGPQGTIPAGTPVWVLGKEGSYTHVLAGNGVNGYVWDSSIVTTEEWNRRQEVQKQNQEADRRIRAKGMGPLGPSEEPAAAVTPSKPAPQKAPAPKPQTPPRSTAGVQP